MNEGRAQEALFTRGPVERTLFTRSVPMMIGLVAMGSFGAVDAYFVSRLGTEPLGALGVSLPLVSVFAVLWLSFGIAATTTVSRSVGLEEGARAGRFAALSLLLTVPSAALLAAAWFWSADLWIGWMSVPGELRPLMRQYVDTFAFGMWFQAVLSTGVGILQAYGRTGAAAKAMTTASVMNLVFDPLLIFGIGPFPELGFRGAALAMVVGYACSAVMVGLSIWSLGVLRWKAPGAVAAQVAALLRVAALAIASRVLSPLAQVAVATLVAGYGAPAAAAFAVGINIERFLTGFALGLSTVLTPFVGQNSAAGRTERAEDAVRAGARWTFLWSVGVALAIFGLHEPIAALIEADAAVRSALFWVLLLYPPAVGFSLVVGIGIAALYGLDRPAGAAWLTLSQQFLLAVPAGIAGGAIAGLPGVFGGLIVGQALACLHGRALLRKAGLFDGLPAAGALAPASPPPRAP